MRDVPRADRFANLWHYVPGQPVPILLRDPATGRVGINELKRYIKPFVLVTEPDVVTLQPGEVSKPIPMTINSDGNVEIMGAVYTSSEPEAFSVMIFDPDRKISLMNREVHVATIASGGGTVSFYEGAITDADAACYYRWPETLWMNSRRGGRALFVRFRNLSSRPNDVRFCLIGQRWYHVQAPPLIGRRMDEIYRERFRTFPYFQTTEQFVRLAGQGATGDSGEFDIRFTDEAHAEWTKSSVLATQCADDIMARIYEKTAGRYLNETALPLTMLFGDGVFPFLLWESNLYGPNTKLIVELANYDSVAQDVWLTLGVRKVVTDPKEGYLART
jgi:hypothetical protein